MIISNSRRFIFVHIPKCGGTSVRRTLEAGLLPQDVILGRNPAKGWGLFNADFEEKFGLVTHSTAAEIAAAMRPEFYRDYFAFTFCRNPFARAYSAYAFTLRADAKNRPDSARYHEIKDMTFEEFARSRYMQERRLFQCRPQADWVQGAAVHVYKLEEIDQVLPELTRRFYGDDAVSEAPTLHRNASAEPNEWTKMTPAAQAIITDLYAEDFVTFGYDTTLPSDAATPPNNRAGAQDHSAPL